MITITKKLDLDPNWLRQLVPHIPMEQILLFDIETTGFSSRDNRIYLIGCIYWRSNQFHFIQWLSECNEDEKAVLFEFSELVRQFELLIDYNGRVFDVPFINQRYKQHGIDSNLKETEELDLYFLIKPFQRYYPLENLKLKTLEEYFGYQRVDQYNGGNLIKVYSSYLETLSGDLKALLLLHNEEDLIGLYYALQSHQWIDFFKTLNSPIRFEESNFQLTKEINFIKIKVPFNAPFVITTPYLHFTKTELIVTIPILSSELKYFLPNYKEYYYLPAEDMVVHQSVAQFVSKENKIKVSKENANIKKRGNFIPLLTSNSLIDKTYKTNLQDKTEYLELTEDLLSREDFIKNMIMYLISRL